MKFKSNILENAKENFREFSKKSFENAFKKIKKFRIEFLNRIQNAKCSKNSRHFFNSREKFYKEITKNRKKIFESFLRNLENFQFKFKQLSKKIMKKILLREKMFWFARFLKIILS